jgi:CRP-like cAMP-binding protein
MAYEQSPRVRQMVQVSSELLIEQIQQTAACHALHSAEQRLGRWLLQCYDYAGNEFLDLTQDFVSEMLGVRRTTVSQVAATLQAEGLIRYRRGHVTVLYREKLLARSCECYEAVMEHRNGHAALKPLAVPPG